MSDNDYPWYVRLAFAIAAAVMTAPPWGFFVIGMLICGFGVYRFYADRAAQPPVVERVPQSPSSAPVSPAPAAGAPKLQPPITSIPLTPDSSSLRTRAEIVAIRNNLLGLMQIIDGDIAPLNQKLNEFVVSQPHRVFVDLVAVKSQAQELDASLEAALKKLDAFMERHRDDNALHNVMDFSETGDPKTVLSRLEQFTYNIPAASSNHDEISRANIYWGAAYALRSVVSPKWHVTLRDRVAALRRQLDSEYSTSQ